MQYRFVIILCLVFLSFGYFPLIWTWLLRQKCHVQINEKYQTFDLLDFAFTQGVCFRAVPAKTPPPPLPYGRQSLNFFRGRCYRGFLYFRKKWWGFNWHFPGGCGCAMLSITISEVVVYSGDCGAKKFRLCGGPRIKISGRGWGRFSAAVRGGGGYCNIP